MCMWKDRYAGSGSACCLIQSNSSLELDVDEEDPGLMVMCETCKVWQHGICVNLSEDAKDQDYYCEQCRPDLHVDLLK